MERGKCKLCQATILYLETKSHISFGGVAPPVQKDGLCPKCWMKTNPGEPEHCLDGITT